MDHMRIWGTEPVQKWKVQWLNSKSWWQKTTEKTKTFPGFYEIATCAGLVAFRIGFVSISGHNGTVNK